MIALCQPVWDKSSELGIDVESKDVIKEYVDDDKWLYETNKEIV